MTVPTTGTVAGPTAATPPALEVGVPYAEDTDAGLEQLGSSPGS
ncbi:hypothetical protein [Streptomyces sp. MC1]|nr:hypothetical protein [Streptomyces sp. MC1]